MRTTILVLSLVAVTACAKPVPLTPDLRATMTDAGTLADLDLRVLGTFELRSGGRSTLTVRNELPGFGATAVNDTTITLRVSAPQLTGDRDTLDLTFALSRSPRGIYTLRAVNGTPLGQSIMVRGTSYQYVPCYQNVGSKCLEPLPSGAQEDKGVQLGVKR